MHIVNKQKPDLPRTPIYRGCFHFPKTRGKSGFYCSCTFVSILQITKLLFTDLCRGLSLVTNLTLGAYVPGRCACTEGAFLN